MAWTEDWTIEAVEQNYRVLGKAGLDPHDIEDMIEDSKTLKRMQDVLGREYNDICEMVDEREDQQRQDDEDGV